MLIVYQTSGGATRRYAEMLSARTGVPAVSAKAVTDAQLQSANCVVFMSWIMGGTFAGSGWLKKKWGMLKGKRMALAANGLAEAQDMDALRASLPQCTRELPLFYMLGAYDPKGRNAFLRFLMNRIADTFARSGKPADQDMAAAIRMGADYVREEALAELLRWISGT